MLTTISPLQVTARIPAARQAISGVVYRIPLEPSAWLSAVTGAAIFLKLECYQPTGSFKVRGAMAAIAHLVTPFSHGLSSLGL
jgi:threonine dehydratase